MTAFILGFGAFATAALVVTCLVHFRRTQVVVREVEESYLHLRKRAIP